MRTILLAGLAALSLSACADISTLGSAAVEKRRMMNDIQARATLAATCDIAIGAYFRELNSHERQLAAMVCGGDRDEGIAFRTATRVDDPAPLTNIPLTPVLKAP